MFSTIKKKRILNKQNIIFITGIITTFSTTAFLALLLFLLLYALFILKRKFYSFFLALFIIIIFIQGYQELYFFSNRINRSIEYFNNRSLIEYQSRDRMISAIVDIRRFIRYPIFGTGRVRKARYGTFYDNGELSHRNNGDTDFLVKYGFFFFVFYFWMIRKGIYYYCLYAEYEHAKRFSYIALAIILILGFSETVFQMSMFIALFYLSSFFKKGMFSFT